MCERETERDRRVCVRERQIERGECVCERETERKRRVCVFERE